MDTKEMINRWVLVSVSILIFAVAGLSISLHYYGNIRPPYGFQALLWIAITNYVISVIVLAVNLHKNKS